MVRTTFGLTSKAMLKASALDAMAKAAAIAARPARACGACPPARRRDDRRRLCGADLHIFVGYLYLQTKMVYCKWVGTFNKCSGRLHLTVDITAPRAYVVTVSRTGTPRRAHKTHTQRTPRAAARRRPDHGVRVHTTRGPPPPRVGPPPPRSRSCCLSHARLDEVLAPRAGPPHTRRQPHARRP